MALSLLLQLSLQRLLFLFDLPEPSLMGCNLLLKIPAAALLRIHLLMKPSYVGLISLHFCFENCGLALFLCYGTFQR